MNMNPLFLIDFYKACHYDQYPKNLTKLVSYLTPRMSRIRLSFRTGHLQELYQRGDLEDEAHDQVQ